MAVQVLDLGGGRVAVSNSSRPDQGRLIFTRDEWAAFVGDATGGVLGGEFDRFGQQAQEGDGTRTHEQMFGEPEPIDRTHEG